MSRRRTGHRTAPARARPKADLFSARGRMESVPDARRKRLDLKSPSIEEALCDQVAMRPAVLGDAREQIRRGARPVLGCVRSSGRTQSEGRPGLPTPNVVNHSDRWPFARARAARKPSGQVAYAYDRLRPCSMTSLRAAAGMQPRTLADDSEHDIPRRWLSACARPDREAVVPATHAMIAPGRARVAAPGRGGGNGTAIVRIRPLETGTGNGEERDDRFRGA